MKELCNRMEILLKDFKLGKKARKEAVVEFSIILEDFEKNDKVFIGNLKFCFFKTIDKINTLNNLDIKIIDYQNENALLKRSLGLI